MTARRRKATISAIFEGPGELGEPVHSVIEVDVHFSTDGALVFSPKDAPSWAIALGVIDLKRLCNEALRGLP